jgi:hypothetical protein
MSSLRRSSRATASVSPPLFEGRRRGSAISRCTSPSDLGVEIKAWQERRLRTFDGVTTIEDIHVCPSQEGCREAQLTLKTHTTFVNMQMLANVRRLTRVLFSLLFWGRRRHVSHDAAQAVCRKEIATWLILPVAYACLKD